MTNSLWVPVCVLHDGSQVVDIWSLARRDLASAYAMQWAREMPWPEWSRVRIFGITPAPVELGGVILSLPWLSR